MKINKITVSASIGTIIEWAEFSFYGYLAYKFAFIFFPKNTSHALTLSFLVFASSYLARPFGAIIFGYIGDYIGRKRALVSSLIIMGVVALCMGVLPTYDSIGTIAPILLVIFRITQGIAVSGEFTGSAIFIAEHHAGKYKNLAISWISVSSAIGMMIGSLMATIISLDFMPEWSWRVPFFLGFISCLIGIYIRASLEETPAFLTKGNKTDRKSVV